MIETLRTFDNKPGTTYNPDRTQTIFAEDMNLLGNNDQDLQNQINDLNPDTAPHIILPVPQIEVRTSKTSGVFTFKVFWRGSDLKFTEYNPKIYLYKFTKLRHKPQEGTYHQRKAFVHPSHLNGSTHVGEKWGGGVQSGATGTGVRFDITTEFDCPTVPFERADITIDPLDWYGVNVTRAVNVFPMTVTDWEDYSNRANTAPRGTKLFYLKIPNKSVVFRFAIVIPNPDPATSGTVPYLISDLSDVVRIFPHLEIIDGVKTYTKWRALVGGFPKVR